MKVGLVLIISGILILIFGIIFHLQGQGIIGPESSFMYSNPEWISYGQQIAILGIVILVVGGSILVKRASLKL
jgi:hypothetical protein